MNEGYNQHISQQFNAELEEARTRFLSMGGVVEQQISDSVQALMDANAQLADEVSARDRQVNDLEKLIDETLVKILAKRQPAASDLRMIIGMSKANTDLERIGDESAKIARIARSLSEEGESPRGYTEARHIGSEVREMLHNALDAFARLDSEAALAVMAKDVDIDREYQTATRSLMTYMMEDPRYLGRVINVLWVLRALERVGDHARNLAEQVIYMVHGADVRHSSLENAKAEIDS